MSIRVGSCYFAKCKNDKNGKCMKNVDKENGVLVMCQYFEYEGYYE